MRRPICPGNCWHQTLSLMLGAAMLVGCADRRQERASASPGTTPPDATAAPALKDAADSPDGLAAGTDAHVRPAWTEPAADSIFATLQREAAGEPLALVETPAGLAAVTPSGRVVRQLVSAKQVSSSSYDVRFSIVWFVRNGTLAALDLRHMSWEPVAVLEQMPPLPLHLFPGNGQLPDDPCGRPCVELSTDPPRFEVHAERSYVVPGIAAEERRIRAIAKYKPVLTASGSAFLSQFKNPASRPAIAPLPLSPDVIAPGVPGAKGDATAGCNGTCGRGFDLGSLGWSVVSTGRTCRCDEDICTARCALFDPVAQRFAPISRVGPWTTTPTHSEPLCDIELDARQVAYRLPDGSRVCTKDGCRKLGGRAFAWLVPGPGVQSQFLHESYSDGCGP